MDPLVKKVLWYGGAYLFLAGIAAGYIALTGTLSKRALDDEMVARGSALYAEHCARCHGADLEGQKGWERRRPNGTIPAPPQDASGHTWQHSDQQIFDIIKLGGGLFARVGEMSEMPAYREHLSDADIWAVIAFIKSRWPDETRAQQQRANLAAGGHSH